jgi:hypothetical protein
MMLATRKGSDLFVIIVHRGMRQARSSRTVRPRATLPESSLLRINQATMLMHLPGTGECAIS